MAMLKFEDTDSGRDEFSLLHQGFLMGSPEGGLKGIEQHKRAICILDKLEEISDVVKGAEKPGDAKSTMYYNTGDVVRKLRTKGGKVEFEEEEVKMLKEHMESVPWRVGVSRLFVSVVDMLGK